MLNLDLADGCSLEYCKISFNFSGQDPKFRFLKAVTPGRFHSLLNLLSASLFFLFNK